MYVIMVYDCGEKRVSKMLKLCRRYLNWIQNSVFEGEISSAKLEEMLLMAKGIIDKKEDSIIIFKGRTQQWMEKEVIGKELNKLDNFL